GEKARSEAFAARERAALDGWSRASACTMRASSTENAVNRRKNVRRRSLVISTIIKWRWKSKKLSIGSYAKPSKRRRPSGRRNGGISTTAMESVSCQQQRVRQD